MKIPANSSLMVHPQVESLRHQNRQLQSEAARLIVERDHLKTVVVPQISAEYKSKIGVLELRVFQFECKIRALIRRIEMANSALNRGKKPSYREIESEIKTEFAAWREKIAAQIREIKAAGEFKDLPTLTRAESRELQSLYRKLAFLLHPDLIGKADERRQKLWLQASEVYTSGDLQTLRTIRLLIGSDLSENDFAGENVSILESLKNRNAELKVICEKLLDEITKIKTSAPYALCKILDDDEALEKAQNDLSEKIENLRQKRRQLAQHWAEILRFAEDCGDIELPGEPADVFAESDMDWAEIIYEF